MRESDITVYFNNKGSFWQSVKYIKKYPLCVCYFEIPQTQFHKRDSRFLVLFKTKLVQYLNFSILLLFLCISSVGFLPMYKIQ